MQERDRRVFNDQSGLVRNSIYRGTDKAYTRERDITSAPVQDHSARPLLTKFSTFNLRHFTPEQRRILVEQIRYELSLDPGELNTYLNERYTEDDMLAIRSLVKKPKNPRTKGKKRQISNRARKPVDPDEMARRIAKAKATREQNKNDPNYVSYASIKAEFLRLQKLVSKRAEAKLKTSAEHYLQTEINRTVYRRTMKLERENEKLKRYLEQNGLPMPGSKAAKMRRERLRSDVD